MATTSRSFSVNVIEDGVVYEITSDISSVTVPTDGVTATLATTLYFWKRVGGGERTAYSCYATLFRKKGNSLYAYSQSSGKVTSWAINQGVPSSSYDAVIVCIYDAASTAHSGYLAELVIPVIKNGDTGPAGEDGQDGQDGQDAVYYWIETNTPVFHYDPENDEYTPDKIKVVAHRTEGDTDSVLSWSDLSTYGLTLQFNDNNGMGWLYVTQSQYANLSGGQEEADSWFSGLVMEQWRLLQNGNVVATTGISVTADGETGPRGKTGPMYYLAGEYSATKTYTLTDYVCPVVYYDGKYYFLKKTSTGNAPTNTTYWGEATYLEMVLTKVLFTQFAKLGGFVVSSDYMLSHYGELFDVDGNKLTLTEVTDENGFRSWQYGGVDAYTYFCEADPMVEHEILPWVERNNWSYWSGYLTTTDTIYITLNETSDAKFSELRDLPVNGHYYFYGTDTNGKFYCLLMRKSSYNSTNKRLYGYREKILDYPSMTMFRPAKLVNAVTGEEWMAGGKVHVTGDGDVTVEGTIRAKNLYHGVCVFIEGGIYSTQWYYVAGTSDWITSKGLSVGDYVEITDAMRAEASFVSTNLLPCTYDADIISMNPNGSANWGSSNDAKTVVLPDPKDFPGKIVEVTSFNYGISAKTAYVGCVAENAFALKVAYNSTSKTVINDTGASVSSITVSTGSPIRLLSIYASHQYWWLRIQ